MTGPYYVNSPNKIFSRNISFIDIHTYICRCVCTYIFFVYLWMLWFIHKYTYICVYVYTNIHTHTHTTGKARRGHVWMNTQTHKTYICKHQLKPTTHSRISLSSYLHSINTWVLPERICIIYIHVYIYNTNFQIYLFLEKISFWR